MVAFPEFTLPVRAAYESDGSGKARFISEVAAMVDDGKRKFRELSDEAKRVATNAALGLRGGEMRFGIDTSAMRQAAADAEVTRQKLVTLRDAARSLADSTGDTSDETRRYIQALTAETIEATRAKQAADAQVTTYQRLQDELERTERRQQALAQAYRDTFLEQARSENAAHRSQASVNAFVAPALSNRATNNGAGFGALDAMVREQEAAAAAMARYRGEAMTLREALDPALVIQRRFDEELERADRLLKAGAISAREYASAQQMARDNINGSWAAITRAQETSAVATARSTSVQRFAMVQLGQQMQDAVVQAQMGTSAVTILTQQGSQAAFALSGLGGRVGAAARVVAGPWGAAILGATALLGPFIARLFDTGNAVDDLLTKRRQDAAAARDGAIANDIFANSLDGAIAKVRSLNSELAKRIQSQEQINRLTLQDARSQLQQLQTGNPKGKDVFDRGGRVEVQRQLDDERENLAGLRNTRPIGQKAVDAQQTRIARAQSNIAKLETRLAEVDREISNAQVAVRRAEVPIMVADAQAASDPGAGIRRRHQLQIDAVTAAHAAGWNETKEGTDAITALLKQQGAELKALESATRAASSNRESGREITSAQARSIAQSAGFQVNSDDRSYASQKRLYDQWVAAGKPSDNPVAKPGTSAHERGNALDIQIRDGVTPASIRKAFQDEGVRLTKVFKERGHFHVEWSTTGADRIKREAEEIDQFGKSAVESIQRINERFDEQPRLIDQAAQATRELQKTMAGLKERGLWTADTAAQYAQATAAIEDALSRPVRDLEQESQRRFEVAKLTSQGRDAEASALQRIWELEGRLGTEEAIRQKITALTTQGRRDEAAIFEQLIANYPAMRQRVQELTAAEQARLEANERILEMQRAYLDASRGIRGEIEGIFSGRKPDFGSIFRNLNAKVLTEQLFGGMFRDFDAWIKKNTGISDANDMFIRETERAGSALRGFVDVANNAAAKLASGGTGSLESNFDATFGKRAANDNGAAAVGGAFGTLGSILAGATGLLTGNRPQTDAQGSIAGKTSTAPVYVKPVGNNVMAMTPEVFARQAGTRIGDTVSASFAGSLGTKLSGTLGSVVGGVVTGNILGGKAGAILGGAQQLAGAAGLRGAGYKAMGDALGGMGEGLMVAGIGNALGLKMSNTGAAIGGALFGPLGGLAGGLLGKLFSSPKWATSVASNGMASSAGNQGEWKSATSGAADSVTQAISSLAEQFDAKIGTYAVSLGLNDGNWHVSTAGRAGRLRGNQGWSDVTDFGEDQKAALAFAIRDAIKDGAIQGRAATIRLLSAEGDLDAQIKKAVDFEAIFTRLKQFKDPVGAAMDALDKEFARLKGIAEEAGEGMVELEELYGYEREKVLREASERNVASLRSLYQSLTTGDSGLSLRARQSNAMEIYSPLEARVRAGDVTAFNDYAEAAQTLLDIERQLYGSQSQYFERFNAIKDLTKSTLDTQTDIAALAAKRDTPFSNSAVPATDNASVVSAIDGLGQKLLDGLTPRLDAVNDNLAQLLSKPVIHAPSLLAAVGSSPSF